MRRRSTIIIHLCLVATAALAQDGAATNTRDYGPISNRNLFDLRQQPAAAPNTQAPEPAALPRLMLTGITTILGDKRALIKALPSGQPGQTNETSFILSQGQREGFLEIVSIDETNGKVIVKNSGRQMTLTFEKDGPKPPSTPPTAVAGNILSQNATSAPPAYALTPGTTNLALTSFRSMPNRSRRGTGPVGAGELSDAETLAQAAAMADQSNPVPPVPVPVPVPVPGAIFTNTPQQPLTPEERAIISEAEAEAARAAAAATVPQRRELPLPPSGNFPTTPPGATAVPGTPPLIIPPGNTAPPSPPPLR